MLSQSQPAAAQPPAVVAPAASGTVAAHAGRARTLLLVDDEATLRSALKRFFMRRGWDVVEATDGEHARALLLDGPVPGGGFDAVLTDLRMPRLSGSELHDLVRAVDPAIGARFVFSSGNTDDDDTVAFIARTTCPVLAKPFELATLLSHVERAADVATATH